MDIRKLYRRMLFELNMLHRSKLTLTEAESKLKEYHFQAPPVFQQHNTIDKQYDLMIVLPVYNVEKYLQQCMDSVFAQKTQYSYYVVAVDDGSTDTSGQLLDQYGAAENLKIIHQKNAGLSGARNTALKQINANYVLFLDSDDYLPEDAVEQLLSVAYEYDANIVQGSYKEFNENGTAREVRHKKEVCRITTEEITGFACMKLIRSQLLENFCFPEGFLYEDTVMSKILYPVCQTAVSFPDVVYYYRQHPNSISAGTQKPKNTDTYWITKYCLEEAFRRGYTLDESQYRQYLQQCWVNYLRTRGLPEEIQQSIFVLTRQLLQQYFPTVKIAMPGKLKLLDRAFQQNSFQAYRFLMERWDIM